MQLLRITARVRRVALQSLLALALGFGFLLLAPSANADTTYIYWTTNNDTWAGRANIDGSSPNFAFFDTGGPSSGLSINSQRIYWPVDLSGFTGHTIGTVNLDGSGRNTSAIDTTAVPYGIAIDGTYIYWASRVAGTIGRANLDGTGADPNFITGIQEPETVAVNGSYIYWGSFGSSPYFGTGKIGRANLDGTGKNLNFITGASNPQGIALTNSHIYWTNGLGGIGRANLDGTSPTQSFIPAFGGPAGIVVTNSHIYWAEVTTFRIMSANINGSGAGILIDLSSTPTSPYGSQPWGLDVHTVPSPSPTLPTLSLTAPSTATTGQTVSIDGATVGGDAAGQSFTLSLDIAFGGTPTALATVTGTAFPLALHPTWTPTAPGTYTVTLNLTDATNNVVLTTSQVITVSAAAAPGGEPDSTSVPDSAPTTAPYVPSIVPVAQTATEAAERALQKLVIVKFAVQKSGRVKVVEGKAVELPGHHAYFTNVTTDPKLVTPRMVRYGTSLARKFGGVYGGIVVGEKWHRPRVVAAYFD